MHRMWTNFVLGGIKIIWIDENFKTIFLSILVTLHYNKLLLDCWNLTFVLVGVFSIENIMKTGVCFSSRSSVKYILSFDVKAKHIQLRNI
jgi:hypothetical protein